MKKNIDKIFIAGLLAAGLSACGTDGMIDPITGDSDFGDNEAAAQSGDDVGGGDQGGDDAARFAVPAGFILVPGEDLN